MNKISIFILDTPEGKICLNSDNEENDQMLKHQGAIKLTDEEVEKYGMKGHENYVSPLNTEILEDGTIKFNFNPKEIEDDRFEMLRQRRNMLLSKTDYLLAADYPIDKEALKKVKAYRQQLRDITTLDGAPWDGGGDETPWPKEPDLKKD